jgi:hypothetical protein
MSQVAADVSPAEDAAVVSPASKRHAKRAADFARLSAGPAKVAARIKESVLGKELDRLVAGIPTLPVFSPNRRIPRHIAAFKNGSQIAGESVMAWNSVKRQWVQGRVMSTSTRRPRGETDAATAAHVLVDVQHLDGTRRAYMVEFVARMPV